MQNRIHTLATRALTTVALDINDQQIGGAFSAYEFTTIVDDLQAAIAAQNSIEARKHVANARAQLDLMEALDMHSPNLRTTYNWLSKALET